MEIVTPLTIGKGAIGMSKPQALPGPNVENEPPIESHGKGKVEKKTAKLQPDYEKWSINDFVKDAAWFAANFGLPNEGESPYKIVDVSEEQLSACFGEKGRSGYKLSTCTGIPTEIVLALSQVVDGYDKPVNGVLSHSFVKGVYVERVLKQKVNWASYASSKLKGQLLQREREGKPRPDCPPCVRKPRMYKPPLCREDPKPVVVTEVKTEDVKPLLLGLEKAITDWDNDCVLISSNPVQPSDCKLTTTCAVTNSLLAIVHGKNSNLKVRQGELWATLSRIAVSMARLKANEKETVSNESQLCQQLKDFESDLKDVRAQIAIEEDVIGELTTDIELESNKQVEDSNDEDNELLSTMEEKMETHKKNCLRLTKVSSDIKCDMETVQVLITKKREKCADVPKTLSQLSAMSKALTSEIGRLDSGLFAQELELSILSEVLCKPLPVLKPTFTLTAAHPTVTEFSVAPCSLCCNGYHQFNWVPASCGHSYHPACLFALISHCKDSPRCKACGEVFSREWLRTWGLDCGSIVGTEVSAFNETMAMELKDVYGKQADRLQRRQEFVQTLNCETHAKGDMHAQAEECLASMPRSESIDLSTFEDGSSKVPELLTPKVEGGETGKKRRGEVKGDQVESAKKVKPE